MFTHFFTWFTKTIFVSLLLFYIMFSLLEEFKEGIVSNYLNLNWLLVAVLVSACLALLLQNTNQEQDSGKRGRPWFLILFSGLVVMSLLWLSAYEFELFWRSLLTVYGGLITIGILLVLFEE